jgi:hypothetical protein
VDLSFLVDNEGHSSPQSCSEDLSLQEQQYESSSNVIERPDSDSDLSEVPEERFHNVQDFRAFSGFSRSELEELIYPRLVQYLERPTSVRGPKCKLSAKHQILLGLYYLRSGNAFHRVAIVFQVSVDTSRRIANTIIKSITEHFADEISWKDLTQIRRLPMEEVENMDKVVGIVDAMEQPCNRPTRNQERYYSGKAKRHTIKSQVTVEPVTGLIQHIKVGFEGRRHDKAIFDESKVTEKVGRREYLLADLAYVGVNRTCNVILPKKSPGMEN